MVLVSLTERIAADLTIAMKAKAEPDRTVLRAVSAALKNAEIAAGQPLDEPAVLAVVDKQAKQRQETIAAAADTHPELAEQERAELAVLERYLPARLTETELAELVEAAIAATGASTAADMGKVMGALKPQIAGRADGGAVAAAVKAKLA